MEAILNAYTLKMMKRKENLDFFEKKMIDISYIGS